MAERADCRLGRCPLELWTERDVSRFDQMCHIRQLVTALIENDRRGAEIRAQLAREVASLPLSGDG